MGISIMREKVILHLRNITQHIQPKPDCWISFYPNDNHCGYYCRDCCQKHVDTLISGFHPAEEEQESIPLTDEEKKMIEEQPPIVDGGWGSESDRNPICDTCGEWTTSIMTDHTIIDELDYIIDNLDKIDLNNPTEAYNLLLCLEGVYSEDSKALETTLMEKLLFKLF